MNEADKLNNALGTTAVLWNLDDLYPGMESPVLRDRMYRHSG